MSSASIRQRQKADSMKICLLLSRVADGGLERVQINLANEFSAAGHEVDFVAGIVLESPYPALAASIPVIEIAREGPWRFVLGLVLYMYRAKPDCILTTSNDAACIAIALRPFLAPNAQIVVTQHSSLVAPMKNASGTARLKRYALYRLMRLLVPLSDARIAVSEGVASDMREALLLTGSPIDVIYNPVVTADYSDKRTQEISWPWPHDQVPTLIYVGRLAIEKRLDILLAAALPILQARQARLLIVGSGPQRNWMEQQVVTLGLQSVAACTGFVQNVLPYIARSDVLVLSSDYEGFGNVLVEALACGVQVVSTDCPHGPREILADGKFGQLVPVGDSACMERAISNSLQKVFYVERERLINRSKDFSTEKAALSYLRIIETQKGPS